MLRATLIQSWHFTLCLVSWIQFFSYRLWFSIHDFHIVYSCDFSSKSCIVQRLSWIFPVHIIGTPSDSQCKYNHIFSKRKKTAQSLSHCVQHPEFTSLYRIFMQDDQQRGYDLQVIFRPFSSLIIHISFLFRLFLSDGVMIWYVTYRHREKAGD